MKGTCIKFLKQVNDVIIKNAEEACYPYVTFGIFAIIMYPLFYLIWLVFNPTGYENLTLRMVVVILAIPLVMKDAWPKKIECFLPLYWYLTITYSLPFLFTYFLLKNDVSIFSISNGLTVVILTILLLDTVSLFVILPLGVLAGFLVYFIQPHHLSLSAQIDLPALFITYSCPVVFGYIFSHKKESLQRQRVDGIKQGMNDILAIIAHEIRTPLLTINNHAVGIEKVLPALIQDHNMAKQQGLSVSHISKMSMAPLSKSTQDIQKEVHYANSTIDLLLTNVINITRNQESQPVEYMPISMRKTIHSAITRYPFTSTVAMGKVLFEEGPDFTIRAPDTLMENVFTNLIKNALYYTSNGQTGDITIKIEVSQDKNVVIFQDSGTGIEKEYLKKIFNQFFTLRREGVGIGLFFCKKIIESCGGEISCESQYGQYTRFIMEFRA